MNLSYDRTTEVAYVDVCAKPPADIRIDVVDVTDQLGLKTQVLARVTTEGVLLGIIIQDYPAFKRELRRKYLSFAVERLLDLILSKVRDLTRDSDCDHARRMPAHALHA